MRLKAPPTLYILLFLAMFFATAILLTESAVAAKLLGRQPEVQVTRPAAVIIYDPGNSSQNEGILSSKNKYNQKNMIFKWHQKLKPEADLEISLKSDLELVSAKNKEKDSSFGFSRFNENITEKIPAEAVLVKKDRNDSNYQSLDKSREILTVADQKVKLKFKIDESKIADSWQNLPAGTYKAELESNNYEFKNNPRVQVNVKEHLEIDLGDKKRLDLEINDPTLKGDPEKIDQYNDSLSWEINSNTPVNVRFSSQGSSDHTSLTESEAKEFFRYVIKNGDINKQKHFSPAETKTVDFSKGELKVLYSTNFDFEQDDGLFASQEEKQQWHQLTAGKYQDTIKITVEAQ